MGFLKTGKISRGSDPQNIVNSWEGNHEEGDRTYPVGCMSRMTLGKEGDGGRRSGKVRNHEMRRRHDVCGAAKTVIVNGFRPTIVFIFLWGIFGDCGTQTGVTERAVYCGICSIAARTTICKAKTWNAIVDDRPREDQDHDDLVPGSKHTHWNDIVFGRPGLSRIVTPGSNAINTLDA
jgi:hypothetical protein